MSRNGLSATSSANGSGTNMVPAAGAVSNGNGAHATPGLVFFYSATSGPSRRVEGFLAQVLQRRGNHRTFRIYRVPTEDRPDLAERFHIEQIPTLMVVDERRVRGRLETPRGCEEIETFLSPWLK